MPTVGCHCSHCIKIFGNRSQNSIRKKSRMKLQQQLQQQLQWLLMQQQQLQQQQHERLSQENDNQSEQTLLPKSYGVLDLEMDDKDKVSNSSSRKTSTDSAVSTTTPESLVPESPEDRRLLGLPDSCTTLGNKDPNESIVSLSSSPPVLSNSKISGRTPTASQINRRNKNKENTRNFKKLSVETGLKPGSRSFRVNSILNDANEGCKSSNISTTTVLTSPPHIDTSQHRTCVTDSCLSSMSSQAFENNFASSVPKDQEGNYFSPIDVNLNLSQNHSSNSLEIFPNVEPAIDLVMLGDDSGGEYEHEENSLGSYSNDGAKSISSSFLNLVNDSEVDSAASDEILLSRNVFSTTTTEINTSNSNEVLAEKQQSDTPRMVDKKSRGRLQRKYSGPLEISESQTKIVFPSLLFDTPATEDDILPLYRKAMSESNIFAKDNSSVERRKLIASKNFENYFCKSAQPRFDEYPKKDNSNTVNIRCSQTQHSEVNPFSWDIQEFRKRKEARQLKAGDDITHTEGSQKMGASVRVTGQDFSSHKSAVSEAQQRRTVTPAGTISAENSRKLSKSGLTITTKGVCTKQSSSMSSSESNISVSGFEDFDLGGAMQPMDVQNAIMKYSGVMTKFVDQLKTMSLDGVVKAAPTLLDHMNDMMKRAWSVPTYGHELGYSLCNVLKNNGGLDILLENCTSKDSKLKFSSAKVLEQCLTTENRGYVVEKGLENVVNVACDCTQDNRSMEQSRVGTGILEHLFKHSEGTCSDIIRMGGLEAVVRECRKKDVETLRHCAGALANLSLYGGSENQQAMVQRQVAIWLFPLAFHDDDNIKYYACLAIAALVANAEIEAQVLKADTLSLIEPFVNSHLPEEFANSTVAHRHGQSRDWLERLVPVLSSKREEARNLAAFHFCMEAGIKKNQGNIEIFREIDAIEPLKKVASSPNAIASKYAAHALRLMGEEVPHKLSQQVPLWQATDVQEWVKQIGFSQYADAFIASRVDGDLLLQIGEDNLTYDIGITNGILRQRFLRELKRLRQITDYSSKDPTGLNSFMLQLGPEFAEYTYKMLLSGATKNTLRFLTDEQLASECGIVNSIHRQRLKEGVIVYEKCRKIVKNKKNEASTLQDSTQLDKTLDVFISYRRSNGSQLASLLKVHMQLKGFSVFIDVERLEAGKFDNNLLGSIRQARNFLLVLTPSALDRCLGDHDCKDWVHKEIVAALDSGCNIIPIIDNFHWPEPEQLPDDMRAVCYFNGVRWIHDYQDACVDKLERFMRGEGSLRGEPPGSLGRYQSTTMLTQPGTPSPLPRVQPVYQRTTSTESGKGSSCSDKDFTGKD
ncbi:NAD(+) hydrolase sarm1 isoform X4 [Hyalella azteca]|uniref:ADP-ribosyl cyclase/cyclic ADP-ribose hydrolase n=1 Tax=Hyalella azteca TaxID=294128 RepID=A0A979FXQ8_HYAAZ|nr:NAD(+) hydrolase sarm1 isoform X4 [Hyalella azteca]